MSKRALIIGMIVAVVVIVGAVLLFDSGNKSSPSASNSTASTTKSNPTINFQEPVLSTTTTPDGMKIEIIKKGSGPAVKSGDTVSIDYIGELDDAQHTVFDSSFSRGTPFQTQIGV